MNKIYSLILVCLCALGASAQTYNGGTWYSLYQNQEFNQGSIGTLTKEFDVFPPTQSTLTFQWKNKKFWFSGTYGSAEITVYESTDGSSYGDGNKIVNCDVQTDHTSYVNDSYTIVNPSQLTKMKWSLYTSYGAWMSYFKLPLAKHILLSGGDYGKSSVSKTYVDKVRVGESANIRADFRSFLTAGDISISLTEGDPEVFRLGAADNTTGVLTTSTAGKTYAVGANACASANGSAAQCANGQLGKIGNYSFQIYFFPKAVTDYKGTITITDGTSTATIKLSGTGIKMETLEVPVALNVCEGSSEWYRETEYTEAGVYEIPAEGEIRDTLYQVTVTVLQPTFGAEEKTITYGAEEEWNGIALEEKTVGTHELFFYTTNAAGCDSTVTLTLTVNKLETLEVEVPLSFCAGGSEWYRGTEYTEAGTFDVPAEGAIRDTLYQVTVTVLQPTEGTEEMTITYGDAEEWHEIDLSEKTVGTHELYFYTANAAGCDSTVTLTLTVNKQETLNVPVELSFCAGGSEWYRGVEYTEAGTFDVPAEGEIRDTLYNVTVTVLQPTEGTDEKTIVYGAEEEWNGIDLSEKTVGTHELYFYTANAAGCDSTVTLMLTVNKQETLEVEVPLSFCAGGSAEYRGAEYTEAGTFDVPAEGEIRDTLYNVTVTVLQPTEGTEELTITYGDAEEWNGIALNEKTVGTHELYYYTTNAAGCDSTVTLTLTVNKQEMLNVPVELSFCAGGSAEYRGAEYTETGTFDVPVEGAVRDTLYKVNVTVLQPTEGAEEKTITYGAEEEWNGIALNDKTVGTHELYYYTANAAGCDSTVTLTLTVNKLEAIEAEPVLLGFCPGDSVEYRGKWYFDFAQDTILAEGEVRDTIIYVEAMILPTVDLTVLYDTIVSGNEVILPEGEWIIGEDTVSGTYPTVESEETAELVFRQFYDNIDVCGPNYVELVVTVNPKEEQPENPTDIEGVLDGQKAEKILHNGVIYIRRGERIYGTDGRLVK